MRLAFTGHRPNGLPFKEDEASEQCRNLKIMLWQEILGRIGIGYDTFYCGAAMGADIICGELVLLAKPRVEKPIKLICVVPFRGQAERWSETWQARYRSLLDQSDEVVCLSETYNDKCFSTRNRYLVDHADTLLAVFNGNRRSGTSSTVNYAYHQGKEIVCFNPYTLQRGIIPLKETH